MSTTGGRRCCLNSRTDIGTAGPLPHWPLHPALLGPAPGKQGRGGAHPPAEPGEGVLCGSHGSCVLCCKSQHWQPDAADASGSAGCCCSKHAHGRLPWVTLVLLPRRRWTRRAARCTCATWEARARRKKALNSRSPCATRRPAAPTASQSGARRRAAFWAPEALSRQWWAGQLHAGWGMQAGRGHMPAAGDPSTASLPPPYFQFFPLPFVQLRRLCRGRAAGGHGGGGRRHGVARSGLESGARRRGARGGPRCAPPCPARLQHACRRSCAACSWCHQPQRRPRCQSPEGYLGRLATSAPRSAAAPWCRPHPQPRQPRAAARRAHCTQQERPPARHLSQGAGSGATPCMPATHARRAMWLNCLPMPWAYACLRPPAPLRGGSQRRCKLLPPKQDWRDIDMAIEAGADFISLSFVKSADAIKNLKARGAGVAGLSALARAACMPTGAGWPLCHPLPSPPADPRGPAPPPCRATWRAGRRGASRSSPRCGAAPRCAGLGWAAGLGGVLSAAAAAARRRLGRCPATLLSAAGPPSAD